MLWVVKKDTSLCLTPSPLRVVADLTRRRRRRILVAQRSPSVGRGWQRALSDGTICVWLTSTWEQDEGLTASNKQTKQWTEQVAKQKKRQQPGIGVHPAPQQYVYAVQCSGHTADVWCRETNSGKVRVWDLKGTPSATVLEGHSKTVYSIAVSGTRIFSGSDDKTIRVWDISTLTHTHTLDDHTDWVRDIALTQDEQHLVSCSHDSVTQGVVHNLPQLPAYCATGRLSLLTCCVTAR